MAYNITDSGCRGHGLMVLGFTTTSAYHHKRFEFHGEVYPIQHYVIKFVSDLRRVGGFLRVLRFPPAIKLIAMT